MAVKLLGAAYLVWLGARSLVAAIRGRLGDRSETATRGSLEGRAAFRQGLLSNLGNPKMAAFFPSLLPQFAPSSSTRFPRCSASASSSRCMTLVWLTAYAFAVARAGALLARPAIRRAIEAVTGAVLVALGIRLATERR